MGLHNLHVSKKPQGNHIYSCFLISLRWKPLIFLLTLAASHWEVGMKTSFLANSCTGPVTSPCASYPCDRSTKGTGGNNYLMLLFMGQIRLGYLYTCHCLVLYILSLIFKIFFLNIDLTSRLAPWFWSQAPPLGLKIGISPQCWPPVYFSELFLPSLHWGTVRSLLWPQLLSWHPSRCVLVQRRKIINETIWKKNPKQGRTIWSHANHLRLWKLF